MRNACTVCVSEDYLSDQIIQNGEVRFCDFCQSEQNPTIGLDKLAEQVHSVLQEHFYMTSPDPEGVDWLMAKEGNWEQPGELVDYVIMGMIDSSEDVAKAIREHLSEQYDPYGEDVLYEPSPYSDISQYEERPIDTYEFRESWTSFRQEILTESRFFNQRAKSTLDHLFEGVTQLATFAGDPVVRAFGTSDAIFRARLAKSKEAVEEILKGAPDSLGAPPIRYAGAGRMNAEGISMFYGATDEDTCISEIRPPVGSYIVIGRFSPLRTLHLLDLTRLRKVYLRGSLFDSGHVESLSRVQFLKQLETELSRPVMPGSESREYLPTQAVAEYLGAHLDTSLDGIMFSSSQTAAHEGGEQGKNIALFSRACRLEPYDLPDTTKIEISQYSWDDPDDASITIWEKFPAKSSEEENKPPLSENFDVCSFENQPDYSELAYNPSIRLGMECIRVQKIKSVSYQTYSFFVSRHRFMERPEF